MQSKISSFFNPQPSKPSPIPPHIDHDDLSLWENTTHKCINTYQRRPTNGVKGTVKPTAPEEMKDSGKILNKKRSYAQYHLELGQSDFYLRTCSVCGLKYAPGDEGDDKEHYTFHKNYTLGLPFRNSVNQSAVCMSNSDGSRVVSISDSDSPALRIKVHEVVKMMEIELGSGWIFHTLCKVYLFVSSQRIAGCLVVEPIKEAFEVPSSSVDRRFVKTTTKDPKTSTTTLQFGKVTLQREVIKRVPSSNSNEVLDGNHNGAIICENKPVPAVCGVRAIWVTPSNRRKRIATQLLDAMRKSFDQSRRPPVASQFPDRLKNPGFMQSKISSFFNPQPSKPSPIPPHIDHNDLSLWENTTHKCINTYQRRPTNGVKGTVKPTEPKEMNDSGKILNKKRSYAQYHLELGQSDFYLRTCSVCGLKYAPGDEGDDKEHYTFHKNYTLGLPFKNSVNQNAVCMSNSDGSRVVSISDSDSPALRNKVHEIVKMMEIELGSGWIFHTLCKVHLFVSSQRVAGCLVVEPIKEAFEVLSTSVDRRFVKTTTKDLKTSTATLQFGKVTLQREVIKRVPSINSNEVLDGNHNGAIICENKPVPAVCGVRAIWVTPSNRRKRIATQLLDAMRKSFDQSRRPPVASQFPDRLKNPGFMQSKISSFFNPQPSKPSPIPPHIDHNDLSLWENTTHKCINTYQRRPTNGVKGTVKPTEPEEMNDSGKILNKKRSYAQYHLELGQSDFYLRTCSVCGLKYAPGDEGDDKEHYTFHKNYTLGLPFRNSVNQNAVCMSNSDGSRVVSISDSDSPALRNKVHEIVKMMEIELGSGWIFHTLCKVHLFVSSQRVAGCLVVEPIKEAFEVLSTSVDRRFVKTTTKDLKTSTATLQFGKVTLQREVIKRVPSINSNEVLDGNHNGAIICENKPVPAVCGVRAIWVTPSNRRKRIATQLLDAMRKSFSTGFAIEKSQIAFSPPTAAGKALASSYCGGASILVYKTKID